MCYIKAKEVLPKEVIELIQKYVEGKCIYIPKKNIIGSSGEVRLTLERK